MIINVTSLYYNRKGMKNFKKLQIHIAVKRDCKI